MKTWEGKRAKSAAFFAQLALSVNPHPKNPPPTIAPLIRTATWTMTIVLDLPGIAMGVEIIPTVHITTSTAAGSHGGGQNDHLVQMHMKKCQRPKEKIRP